MESVTRRCRSVILSAVLLSGLGGTGCAIFAGFGGSDLQAGVSTREQVMASMGQPAMIWRDPDGREQLAYPRGPAATQTFMAFIAPDGRLERIEKVLNTEHFARIVIGKSDQAAVLRVLGPVPTQNVTYFKARDELVWSWLFCDSWNQQAYFDVLFDGSTGIVRSTQQRQRLSGWDGVAPFCGQ